MRRYYENPQETAVRPLDKAGQWPGCLTPVRCLAIPGVALSPSRDLIASSEMTTGWTDEAPFRIGLSVKRHEALPTVAEDWSRRPLCDLDNGGTTTSPSRGEGDQRVGRSRRCGPDCHLPCAPAGQSYFGVRGSGSGPAGRFRFVAFCGPQLTRIFVEVKP